MEAIDKVRTAFSEVLRVPDDARFEDLAYRRTKGWDSSAHMRIVTILEKELDILFEPDDIADMATFGACLAILREHGVDV